MCHDSIDGYECECPIDYGKSRNCTEIKINPCFKEPCLNNATCIPISTVERNDKNSITYTCFTCKCDQSYNGSKCETLKKPCHSSPCQNSGTSSPCQISGTCENSRDNREYNCKCFPLFTGKSCESPFNPCEPNQCLKRRKVKYPNNLNKKMSPCSWKMEYNGSYFVFFKNTSSKQNN